MGVPSGPFLMLPILGPTNVRDGSGYVVDLLFRPTTWLIGPGEQLFFNSTFLFEPTQEIVLNSIQTGGAGLAIREEHADELRALKESSLDYYAALRNAFYQHRTAEIWDRRESHRRPAAEETRSATAETVKPAG
jgi:phospholipid-binding lipoprotein MlaA